MRRLWRPSQTIYLMHVCAIMYWPGQSFSQSDPASPVFEVASIRASKPGTDPALIMAERGKLSVRGFTVEALVQFGWHVRDFQVSTGKLKLPSQGYDIAAKGSASATDDGLRQMVRELLTDRFKLSLHREMRKLPIYALVVSRNGPKVHASESSTRPAIQIGRGMIDAKNIRLSILAQLLSSRLDRAVLDLTGLKEKYDFTLRWTPEDKPGDSQGGGLDLAIPVDTDGPSIFTAVQEQLGLRLEVQKAPTLVLVIDQMERPTEN